MTARKLDERYKTTVVRYQTTGKKRGILREGHQEGSPRITVTALQEALSRPLCSKDQHAQCDQG